jgi:flagellar biosynthesis protein FlhF
MKIKRFEAPNMAEALRMVRKEFGEEAVILSAKNVKKAGSLFGLKSVGQVVVTAAIDPTAAKDATPEELRALNDLSREENSRVVGQNAPRGSAGIERILKQYTPITRTGQQKLQPKLNRWMEETQEQTPSVRPDEDRPSLYASLMTILTAQGVGKGIATEMAAQAQELGMADPGGDHSTLLAQLIAAKGWLAAATPDSVQRPRTIVLVGANGVGKTTMAAKLAARHLMRTGHKTILVSLDDQRIAGTAELERYAAIMGLPFETAHDPSHLSRLMDRLADAQMVVDTPGLNPKELGRRDALARMIKVLDRAQVHLLFSAAAQEAVMAKSVALFKPLGIHCLLPTHLDWIDQAGPFINQMALAHLPIRYVGTGPQVPEGVRDLTAHGLAAMLLSRAWPQEEEPQATPPALTIVQRRPAAVAEAPYIANRNSDIFHDRSCKSVGRINNDNAVVFKDATEAMSQGFKPCRMCCMSHLVPKPIDRLARNRFAGSRI